MIQQSMASVIYCTFLKESTNLGHGYGGAIFIDNVSNVTVLGCSFYNCMASHGGAIAMKFESILRIQESLFTRSFAEKAGGAIYADKKCFINGNNFTVSHGKSTLGAGMYFNGLSGLNLRDFNF